MVLWGWRRQYGSVIQISGFGEHRSRAREVKGKQKQRDECIILKYTTGVSFEICSLDEQNWKGWKFEIEATALIADARPIPCKVGAALAYSHDCFAAHQKGHG